MLASPGLRPRGLRPRAGPWPARDASLEMDPTDRSAICDCYQFGCMSCMHGMNCMVKILARITASVTPASDRGAHARRRTRQAFGPGCGCLGATKIAAARGARVRDVPGSIDWAAAFG